MMKGADQLRAPVQGFSAGIPWSVHCKAYDAYVSKFGNCQSAETLAKRGGFCVKELDSFYPDWRKESDELALLQARITEIDRDRDSLRNRTKILKDALEINMWWLRGALDCKSWSWDGDQREAAEFCYAKGEAALDVLSVGDSCQSETAKSDLATNAYDAYERPKIHVTKWK